MSFLIIAGVYASLCCSLFDNASKGTKCRFRAESRGENVKGLGFKICQRFIYLIVHYYLIFLERSEVYKFVDIRTSLMQNRTWVIYGHRFSVVISVSFFFFPQPVSQTYFYAAFLDIRCKFRL